MKTEDLTVIKVGTGVLTKVADGTLDGAALVRLVTALATAVRAGHRCLLVSSGAVGAGISAFGLDGYPDDLATRQACAAVGQARLMHTYESLFRNFDISVAQVLLTADDLRADSRSGYLSNTLQRLLDEPNILPILNENDSVAVEELRVGDNDMLSSRVAALIGARRLVLLTSVDGLLEPDTKRVVPQVDALDDVMRYVQQERGRFSIGGMASKLEAVRFATGNGIETFIANGREPQRIVEILEGGGICTRFPAKQFQAQ